MDLGYAGVTVISFKLYNNNIVVLYVLWSKTATSQSLCSSCC